MIDTRRGRYRAKLLPTFVVIVRLAQIAHQVQALRIRLLQQGETRQGSCVRVHCMTDAMVDVSLHIRHLHEHHWNTRPQVVGPNELRVHDKRQRGDVAAMAQRWLSQLVTQPT